MAKNSYAPHEILEVHEMLTLKTATVAKSALFLESASNDTLKQLLEEEMQVSTKAVQQLEDIIKKS